MAETYNVIVDMAKVLAGIGATNAPQAAGAGGTPDAKGLNTLAESTDRLVEEQQKLPGFLTRLGKRLGINVGISSILKQSQIFTGTVGSMFQILGALVDVILAPFLPVIVPIIRLMGNMIPVIHKTIHSLITWYKEKISNPLDKKIDNLGGSIIQALPLIPQDMKDRMEEWWRSKNWGSWLTVASAGAAVLFRGAIGKGIANTLKLGMKVGIIKGAINALAKPLLSITKLIPGLGGVSKAALAGLAKVGATKAAGGAAGGKAAAKLKTAEQIRADKIAAKAATKGGGMFGKVTSGFKLLGKGGAKKMLGRVLPGVGALITAYDTVKSATKVFKANKAAGDSFWKAAGKASIVAGVGAGATAMNFMPGFGGLLGATAGYGGMKLAEHMLTPKVEVNITNADGTIAAQKTVDASNTLNLRQNEDGLLDPYEG